MLPRRRRFVDTVRILVCEHCASTQSNGALPGPNLAAVEVFIIYGLMRWVADKLNDEGVALFTQHKGRGIDGAAGCQNIGNRGVACDGDCHLNS